MAKNSFVAEVTFKVSHHPDKFGRHKHCGSGDVMIQNCHGISQEHVIKESGDFMARCS